jgi:hypothetical protein
VIVLPSIVLECDIHSRTQSVSIFDVNRFDAIDINSQIIPPNGVIRDVSVVFRMMSMSDTGAFASSAVIQTVPPCSMNQSVCTLVSALSTKNELIPNAVIVIYIVSQITIIVYYGLMTDKIHRTEAKPTSILFRGINTKINSRRR